MGDGSYLCFVRHTEIHPRVRTEYCIIHFQQPVRFVAIHLRDQRRGLSARHYRIDDGCSSRCWRIYPDSIGTRLIDWNWHVCDYVVVFLLDTRCRQMELVHGPDSVESHRGVLVQGCRPSLCLCRAVFGITAEESRPASVQLMSRCWRSDSRLPNVSVGSGEISERLMRTERSCGFRAKKGPRNGGPSSLKSPCPSPDRARGRPSRRHQFGRLNARYSPE